tara:strand:- start:276 stop:1133 length:858 start_codon:yes stop_codon:yes gene_type:complete
MARNNEERTGAPSTAAEAPSLIETQDKLSFSVPTEVVDLPSKGLFYPEGHPLHGKDTVEIKYMTAKEEDILTSESLLRKGTAIDRMLQNLILDEGVHVNDLFVGDKNALLIAARISGYGEGYDTTVTCPACYKTQEYTFDLAACEPKPLMTSDALSGLEGVSYEDGVYSLKLPRSGATVSVRLLSGKDEKDIEAAKQNKKKYKLPDSSLTDLLKAIIVSVNGSTARDEVNNFVDSMPALDSRHIRKMYPLLTPNIDMSQDFQCSSCGHEQALEVPVTANFFWPEL